MIEVTQYQCEVCGTFYKDAKKCMECESFHIPVLSDQMPRYKYHAKEMGPESKYPHAVVLKMADNTTLTFKR